MLLGIHRLLDNSVALPTEGVDRNLVPARSRTLVTTSPSPRRAWIEMYCLVPYTSSGKVALPTEGVDRNVAWLITSGVLSVALPTEGVDRN